MPFLRRRGVMASESDMRRHTGLDRNSDKPNNFIAAIQPPSRPGSASGLAASALSPVQESGPPLVIPAPPATPPNDGMSPSSIQPAITAPDPFDRPVSPPVQDETPKHRRFSMLRFRNASDSQLAAKAKQHAAAEKRPPIPRRMSILLLVVKFQLRPLYWFIFV